MKYDSNTPRHAITIEDVELEAIAPFKAGHVLNENEANVLNQTFRENLRNNMASAVKKAVAAGQSTAQIQEALDTYTLSYEFGVRKAGGGVKTADPVMKEAKAIAKERITKALKAKGYKIKEVPAAQISGYVEGLLKKDPSIMALAKKRVEEAKAAGKEEMDDIIDLPSKEVA